MLHPLNRAWLVLGLLLHRVVNPVIMAVMFYGAILPKASLLRALARTCCGSSASRKPPHTGFRANRRRRAP